MLPIAVLRPHDGQPVSSVTFVAAPHRPDHIILITGVIVMSFCFQDLFCSLQLSYVNQLSYYLLKQYTY